MSQNTEKSKPIPKNRTLKLSRCPRGQVRNAITGLCEPIVNMKTNKKTIIGCSSEYEPKDDAERNRAADLDKLNGQQLRDILSELKGEPTGRRYIAGTKTKQDLINLIVCMEVIALAQKNSLEPEPEPAVTTSPEPAVTTAPEPVVTTLPEPVVTTAPEPVVTTAPEPVVAAVESRTADSIYDEVVDTVISDTEPQMTPGDLQIQRDIGILPTDIDSEQGNNFIYKKELVESRNQGTDETLDFLYPELNDPNFNIKIAKRKEFYDTMYDGKIRDIKTHADLLCDADFELMPHQMFVKNFLSFQTPYNALLLYHGLGTGKTCSAIGIAEEARGFMKQIGITERILIVASPNVQNNFRLQLFDERKLEADGDLWNLNTCIGNSLLKEINPTGLRGLSREKVTAQINGIINKYYSFVGYTRLAHFIQGKVLKSDPGNLTNDERKELKIKRIRRFFDNRLIIVDEVHNIRPTDDNKEGTKIASLLKEVCKYAENLRLLLLSATPMYNSYKEIIWLTNILNAVDKRSSIKEQMVFDKTGNFVTGQENGDALLRRKLTGYVSYVRGENPYTFPFRIYPDVFSPENKLDIENYPKIQMNSKDIEAPIQNIPLYVTKLGEYQTHGYKCIMDYLRNRGGNVTDKFGQTKIMPTFENMETFGYTYLEKPIQSLDIVYPSPELDAIITNTQPGDANLETIVQNMVGKNGLARIMKHETSDILKYNYEYKEDTLKKYGRIFNQENLYKYSNKMSDICSKIMTSTGIIIVYSQYIDGGVVPLALALEELGFSRYGSDKNTKSLFKKRPTEPIDAITLKPNSSNTRFYPAKYVMITGDKRFSPNNAADLNYITNPENNYGQNVKVILITKAAAEGLDFKNVRQVHIMEPWYNMNRIEQIIGRGVRNRSHCSLPFEERNVEIYLHATAPTDDEETADMYVYRFAEKKAVQIGKVTRILKENAVDCILNIGQTNFTIDKLLEQAENKEIKIKLSSKPETEIDYQVGDRAFTDMCDYMDNCSFTCSPNATIQPSDTTNDTYTEEFAQINHSMIVKRIRQLFKEKPTYTRTELINSINIRPNTPNKQLIKNIATNLPNDEIEYKYTEVQIDFALSRFVNNSYEHLIDKYGRRGHLINSGDIYAFQPTEITDETASTFERSMPVEYKPTTLKMALPLKLTAPPETTAQIASKINIIQNKRTYDDVMNDVANMMKYAIEMKDTTTTLKPDNEMKDTTTTLKPDNEIDDLTTGETVWFKLLGNVSFKLKMFHVDDGLSDDMISKFAVHHYLDTLSLNDRLLILQYLYADNDRTLNTIEEYIKDYFDKHILRAGPKTGFIILDDANPELFKIFSQDTLDNTIWNEIDITDDNTFNQPLSKLISSSSIYNDIIGFMGQFKESNRIVFKTKNMKEKRNNKGAYCENAGKRELIERLNAICNRPVYSEQKLNDKITIEGVNIPNTIWKNGLCVMTEILLRHYDDIKHLSKRWFFNPEEVILNRITAARG